MTFTIKPLFKCQLATSVLVLLLSFTYFSSKAQQVYPYTTGTKVELKMTDGSTLLCEWISDTDSTIVCSHPIFGQLTLAKSNIKQHNKIKEKDIVNLRKEYTNLDGRYYFAPSAICMKKGEGYYQNTLGLLQTVNYAFTDFFTMGFSTELITLALRNPIVILTPKIGVEVAKNFSVGAGWFHFSVFPREEESEHFNIGYTTFTYGNRDKNISVNIGRSSEGLNRNTYAVCGFYRISKKVGLMYENWFLPVKDSYYYGDNEIHYTPIISAGVRLIGRRGLFDIGLLSNPIFVEDFGIFGLPVVSYTVRF
jgi:hypothetical protein